MSLLLHDFSQVPGAAAAGWTVIADRVMGGHSSGQAAVETVAGRRALRLRGTVSLADGGGFLQVARPFDLAAPSVDGRAFEGLALTVRGGPGSYFVHLRTGDTRAPWEHYRAPLAAGPEWSTVVVCWSDFTARSLRAPLDPGRLVRLGLVAAGAAFEADIALATLSLVP
ncbi:MAG TPA: CIA30 family protein [Myxococcaceae bacterium]|nr:CIA30 family protein [Myxococcaceae bacterium]